jgi:hypothetical protein
MCTTEVKAISTCGMKCIARNRPVTIWVTRHSPTREPIFHQIDRFMGAGRSMRLLLTILARGWDFRMGWNIFEWAKGAYIYFCYFYNCY